MPAVRAVFSQVLRLEDDDTPVAARSRRDWIVDSALFLFAAVVGLTAAITSAQQGLRGPLLAIDAIGGAVLCLATLVSDGKNKLARTAAATQATTMAQRKRTANRPVAAKNPCMAKSPQG